VRTIGWDDDYQTHAMKLTTSCDPTGAESRPWAAAVGNQPPRYRGPGWTWCFPADAGHWVALNQLGSVSGGPDVHAIYNGPLWNVRVSSNIIQSHTDIWNPIFRQVLLQLFTDERDHPNIVQGSNRGDERAQWQAVDAGALR
jgi:hypothetical protein